MELLGDAAHVESRFFPFGDSVNVGAWFVLDVPWAQKSFWMQTIVPLGDVAQVQARFGPFGHSTNLDTRHVHLVELLGDVDHAESHFFPFGDSISVGAR
jgi:hypothetical protein